MRDATCDCGAACEAGMDALYREYSAPLLRFVHRCGAERGLPESQLDAEGVVHETFEQMLRYPGPISHPPAWLYAVARRRVARIHHGQRRHAPHDPAHLIGEASADVRWTSLAARAPAEDVMTARAVMNAIADLPDHQRTATYLRQVEGWSLSEIGDYLSCASATAGVHVHRGTRAVAFSIGQVTDKTHGVAPARASAAPAMGCGAVIALLLVMAVAAGLLYWFGAPLWLVLVGSLAPVVLTVTGACLWSWRAGRKALAR